MAQNTVASTDTRRFESIALCVFYRYARTVFSDKGDIILLHPDY